MRTRAQARAGDDIAETVAIDVRGGGVDAAEETAGEGHNAEAFTPRGRIDHANQGRLTGAGTERLNRGQIDRLVDDGQRLSGEVAVARTVAARDVAGRVLDRVV